MSWGRGFFRAWLIPSRNGADLSKRDQILVSIYELAWIPALDHVCNSQDIHTEARGNAMASNGKRVEAVAYIRTSSAANIGTGKDSDKRQRAAIEGYAKRAGFILIN